MSIFNTAKIRKNSDLIWPFIGCFFGDPIKNCPFRSLYAIKDEIKQIEMIENFTQKELDEMRNFHANCMERLICIRRFTFREYSDTQHPSNKEDIGRL